MEQKKVTYTIEVKGDDGYEKSIKTNCCTVLAVTDVGTERLVAVNATGEDLLYLYRSILQVKKLIETSASAGLKTYFELLEVFDGEVPDVD